MLMFSHTIATYPRLKLTTKYPASIDDNISLPSSTDNFTPVRAAVTNDLRGAILAIESTLGVKPAGVYSTIRARLDALEGIVGNLKIIELDGDLLSEARGGTLEDPLVVGLWGRPISSVQPQTGEILSWNGIAWVPSHGSTVIPQSIISWGDIQLSAMGAFIIGSAGIASVNRLDVGKVAVTFITPINIQYAVVGSANIDGGGVTTTSQNTNGFIMERADAAGVAFDGNFSFSVFAQPVIIPPTPPLSLSPIAAWGRIGLTSSGATITGATNVASALRTDIGKVTITFGSNISTSYVIVDSPATLGGGTTVTSQSASGFTIERADEFGVAADRDFAFMVTTTGIAPAPPVNAPQSAFSWGRVSLTGSGATLVSSFNAGTATRTDVGTVSIQLGTLPASLPFTVVGMPVSMAGSVVELSQSGDTFIMERGDIYGLAIDSDFTFVVYAHA